jgi:hypothetical protein
MRQPLAACTEEQALRGDPPPAGPREPARHRSPGHPHPPPRAPARPRQDGGGSREHGVQWWVTGHWRTYWCGRGRTRREDRWIAPYLAGPDGKLVRGTDRVRVWDL